MGSIIGRQEEIRTLNEMLNSKQSEFLAIYGRRRIGKTFLIREFFQKKNVIFFNITGTKEGTLTEQIKHFTEQIGEVFYPGLPIKPGKNWDETFDILTKAIKYVASKKKIVLFFDELPWMATPNSRLVSMLSYYWNQHWSNIPKIKLIISGSSASWITKKIIKDKGGLHNRVTRTIFLAPFKLDETRNYLQSTGIKLDHKQILQIYMVMGGVPYYLSKIEKGLTASQNIDKLAFRQNSFLLKEFDNLFASLFEEHELYIKIVRLIAQNRFGIGQSELLKQLGKKFEGKGGLDKLKDLQDANFITHFNPYGSIKKGIYYKVVDPYTLFYFDWIEPVKNTLLERGLDGQYWESVQNTASWFSWAGYSFESLCYDHLSKIRHALSLSPSAIPGTWRKSVSKGSLEQGAQIDLLFDRNDDAISLCEIKHTSDVFVIDKGYADVLRRKISIFKESTKTKKQIFLCFICSNGLKHNMYAEDLVSNVVTLEDLF